VRRRKRRAPQPSGERRRAHVDRLARQIGGEPTRDRRSVQWLAVFDGKVCVGHLISRGRGAVEAFDKDDRSLGVFPSLCAAAAAIDGVAENVA
jgi:hypothetical protein